MHMADALISPIVGGGMLAATTGVAAYSVKKIKSDIDESKIPLMGVMGAFIFAVQMINFTIPGTGSSGHIGGGILLAALLGPYAGFLTIAGVILIQALFFADGGLLAYGCNVFNMGFYACFVAYPLIYKWIIRKGFNAKRIFLGSVISSVVALQLGAFSVVLQTLLSGKTELPFSTFVLFMQPIHLIIGLVEGLVTAAVVTFVFKQRPEILQNKAKEKSAKSIITVLLIATVLIGGIFSWYASENPDGLEWSISKTADGNALKSSDKISNIIAEIQEKISLFPDYNFKNSASAKGTSFSGIIGGAFTLILSAFIGFILYLIKKKHKNRN